MFRYLFTERQPMPTNHNVKAVELTVVADEIQATMLIAELAAAGIKAASCGNLTAGLRAEVPGGVHILVGDQDLEKAQELLKTINENIANLDWDKVDLGPQAT